MPKEGVLKVLGLAKKDREEGKQVLVANMKKNKKFQKETAYGRTDMRRS